MTPRHFVFLQGLPGPALRRLATRLADDGAAISRINFNGGDWADWGWRGTLYRGDVTRFADWFERWCRARHVTDIVLFGDSRPLHLSAIAVARQLQLDVHVLEEGYLRPNTVTLERWRRGQPWVAPATLAACAHRAGPVDAERAIAGSFQRRMREAAAYWAWTVALWPVFWRYRSHRPVPAWRELIQWIRRRLRRSGERRMSAAAERTVQDQPFFLFPLQLDGDAQLVHRSPFAAMRDAVAAVMDSFARHAPGAAQLVVKRHPFDPDPQHWRQTVEAMAQRRGIGHRVHMVEFGDLDHLLERCRGVVTVNSTVGGLALRRGTPVHVLGSALYAMPGLATAGDLSGFWTDPAPPVAGGYDLFSAALRSECLLNAGFHSEEGLARLADLGAARLLQP